MLDYFYHCDRRTSFSSLSVYKSRIKERPKDLQFYRRSSMVSKHSFCSNIPFRNKKIQKFFSFLLFHVFTGLLLGSGMRFGAQFLPRENETLFALSDHESMIDHSDTFDEENIIGQTIILKKGENLLSAIRNVVGKIEGVIDALDELSHFIDLRRLRDGQQIEISYVEDGDHKRLSSIILKRGLFQRIVVLRDNDGFLKGRSIKSWYRKEIKEIVGFIQTSLYHDSLDLGVSVNQIYKIFDIFSSSIDFYRDLRIGDRFHYFYEVNKDGWGRVISTGQLTAACVTATGKEHFGFFYSGEKGEAFFNEKGRGLKKALLLTPIRGGVLTSGYGRRRNPIHGYTEFHPALDFGANIGTPVVAAGDGKVVVCGWDPKGYGKYLKIKHNNNYTTLYAHMSAFALGITSGKRVKQGDIIGYVGTTGMSTGPHLHYEIIVGNKKRNPVEVLQSMGSTYDLGHREIENFSRQIEPYLLKLRNHDRVN